MMLRVYMPLVLGYSRKSTELAARIHLSTPFFTVYSISPRLRVYDHSFGVYCFASVFVCAFTSYTLLYPVTAHLSLGIRRK